MRFMIMGMATKEVAGFSIIQAKSLVEAIA